MVPVRQTMRSGMTRRLSSLKVMITQMEIFTLPYSSTPTKRTEHDTNSIFKKHTSIGG